jgi:hypothetical protein
LCRHQKGDEENAVLLLGASEQLYQDLGVVCQDGMVVLRELALGQLCETVGDAVNNLLERGRGLSADETTRIALLNPEPRTR